MREQTLAIEAAEQEVELRFDGNRATSYRELAKVLRDCERRLRIIAGEIKDANEWNTVTSLLFSFRQDAERLEAMGVEE